MNDFVGRYDGDDWQSVCTVYKNTEKTKLMLHRDPFLWIKYFEIMYLCCGHVITEYDECPEIDIKCAKLEHEHLGQRFLSVKDIVATFKINDDGTFSV